MLPAVLQSHFIRAVLYLPSVYFCSSFLVCGEGETEREGSKAGEERGKKKKKKEKRKTIGKKEGEATVDPKEPSSITFNRLSPVILAPGN